ncbi:hypothetical protein VIGAN_01416300 [Vigna angularis var. angularis]|uniref:Uncharacterized protein n=1 Tax=Vigna angularis var. angularis TaxID=157739 RepID=A0A0S3R6L7_PHAAN|nr:hypothetical protein VIGAN_01416300 [Vigna angularis var. angularis]
MNIWSGLISSKFGNSHFQNKPRELLEQRVVYLGRCTISNQFIKEQMSQFPISRLSHTYCPYLTKFYSFIYINS